MKTIPLSKGKYVAIVSNEDFRKVNKYNWNVHFSKGVGRKKGFPYARANVKGKKVYLHRFVMQAEGNVHVDHLNHCTLDCRRKNLEIVTPKENLNRRRK